MYICVDQVEFHCGHRRGSHYWFYSPYLLVCEKSRALRRSLFFLTQPMKHTHTHTIRAGPPHVKIQVYFQDIITYQEIQQKNGCTLDSQIPTDHLALGIVLNAKFKSSISITFALGQEQQLEQTIFNVSNYLLQVFVCSFLLLSCL